MKAGRTMAVLSTDGYAFTLGERTAYHIDNYNGPAVVDVTWSRIYWVTKDAVHDVCMKGLE